MMTDSVEKSNETRRIQYFLLFCLICEIMAKREDRSESYDIIRVVLRKKTEVEIVTLLSYLKKKRSEYNFFFHKFRTKCVRVADRRSKKSHRLSEE